jgi:hypothetical protein
MSYLWGEVGEWNTNFNNLIFEYGDYKVSLKDDLKVDLDDILRDTNNINNGDSTSLFMTSLVTENNLMVSVNTDISYNGDPKFASTYITYKITFETNIPIGGKLNLTITEEGDNTQDWSLKYKSFSKPNMTKLYYKSKLVEIGRKIIL